MKKLPYFDALPPYAGGKRSLLPWIFGQLETSVPQQEWEGLTFIDAFSGGGAVSMQAKLAGFGHLIANDLSGRSQVVLQALIANHHKKLTPIAPMPQTESGFVYQHFAGSVFSLRHAQALDALRFCIESSLDPIEQALLRLLLWKRTCKFVSFGTSIGTSNRPFAEALDGQRPFSDLNPKRLRDGSLAGLLEPCWTGLEKDIQTINKGVFPALGAVTTHQKDVFELLPTIRGDILYLDPPYADTLGYAKVNEVLDAVLFGRLPETGESPFTQSTDAITELLDVSRHVPVWILSYNDKVLNLDELQTLVQRVEPGREVKAYAKDYKHLAHVAKRENKELLIIATK